MEKNKVIKRTDKKQVQAKQDETKKEIEAKQIELINKVSLKKLEEGVFHDGEKALYTTPPDTEWNCCCINGDKEL